jgi:hypothetical protein
MPHNIIILPYAELDIKESIDFYKANSKDTAFEFIEFISNSFKVINENPKAFPITKNEIRKYIKKKFPFCIYYI